MRISDAGEFVYLKPSDDDSLPAPVKNAGAEAINTYESGEEVSVPVYSGQLSVRLDIGVRALVGARLPYGMKEVPFSLFERCEALREVIIPDTVEIIGSYAFCFCTALEKIVFPENLRYVGENAFFYCSSLKELSFPKSVERVEADAMLHCDSIEKISFYADTRVFLPAFFGLSSLKEIHYGGSQSRWEKLCADSTKRGLTVPGNIKVYTG